MKRAIILSRWYWKPSNRAGSSQVYEECTLLDLTDKQLEKKLTEMNEGYRTSTWSVKLDFDLSKKSAQRDFLKYCVDCYYESYPYNLMATKIGQTMVDSQRERFPYFK